MRANVGITVRKRLLNDHKCNIGVGSFSIRWGGGGRGQSQRANFNTCVCVCGGGGGIATHTHTHTHTHTCMQGAQWLSGRVLDSRPRVRASLASLRCGP